MENIEDKIDRFLAGGMSEEEISSFEQEVSANPEIGEELAFQKTVIGGIKEYRKIQLKGRLDAIQVSGGTSLLNSLGSKVAVGTIAIGVGVGTWFLSQSDNDVPVESPAEALVEPKTVTKETLETPELVVAEVPEEEVIESDVSKEKVVLNKPTLAENKEEVNKEDPVEEERLESFAPAISLPSEDFSSGDDDFVASEVSTSPVENPATLGSSLIDIEVIDGAKNKSFKYFDGKLALFGDFSSSPYEVIELDSSGERDIYLFHDEKYYPIILTRITIPLSELEDESIIRELNKRRGL